MRTKAETMLEEARANLAHLQRYATRMGDMPEGRRYLSLIHDVAENGLAWALAHCHTEHVA